MSLTEAEITKLAANMFLTTKISYANSIGDLADAVGADAHKILEAVGSDSRIGHKYLRPGFGFGGPCLVRDNAALGNFADAVGIPSVMGRANDTYNDEHTRIQIEKYLREDAQPYAFRGSVTYKPGTVLLDNSQQLKIVKALIKAGKTVCIEDPKEVIDVLVHDPDLIAHPAQVFYRITP